MAGNPIAAFGANTVIIDGATQLWDCATASGFVWTPRANRTMSAPINMAAGHRIEIDVIQDAAGNESVTWPSSFVWAGVNNAPPVLQTQPGARDRIRATYDSANAIWRAEIAGVRVIPVGKTGGTSAAGPITLSVGDMTGAASVWYASSNAAPGTVTTRTATQVFADDPDAYQGKTWFFTVSNSGVGVLTMAGGVGVSFFGTQTVLQNTTRTWLCSFVGPTTLFVQSMGTGTFS